MQQTKTVLLPHTMRMQLFISGLLVAAVAATPAIVWKKSSIDQLSPAVHSSFDIASEEFFANELSIDHSISTGHTVVFLLGRGPGGVESLSALASEGLLPSIAAKQGNAESIHHQVSGVKSAASVASEATRLGHKPRLVNLDEYINQVSRLTGASELDSAGHQVLNTKIFIVNVDATYDPKFIDSTVASAIENKSVSCVILSAVRSLEEVRQDRLMQERHRLEVMENAGRGIKTSTNRRRLEEVDGDDAAKQAQNSAIDLSGIYYVSLTPNILAGLLFFVLFCVITYIGVGCMAMISGQDVFVSKLPVIGREA